MKSIVRTVGLDLVKNSFHVFCADAEAICAAAQRPNKRFAPVKSEEASAVLAAHRTPRHLMKQRTMNVNHVWSVCDMFGVVAELTSAGWRPRCSSAI